MHSIESRSVIGPSSIPFGGVYVCTNQAGNCTGWGSEGAKPTVSALLNAVGTESVRNGALTMSVMAGSRYGRHSAKERFCNGGKFA